MPAEPAGMAPPAELVQAADAGDAEARNRLGLWYEEHLPETPYARIWFERAAEQGHRNAMHNLGILAARSDDDELAIAWYNKAVAAGSVASLYFLGRLHLRNGDIQSAFGAFDEGARGGDSDAQFTLSALISEHKLKDHYDLAYYLMNRKAKEGRADAQRILGMFYSEGIGTEPDPDKAMSWWLEAARNGDMAAQFNLGLAYHEGNLVKQDRIAAIRFLMAAAAQGDEEARTYQARVEAELTAEETRALRDELETSQSATSDGSAKTSPPAALLRAAQAGNAEAQGKLSRWYLDHQPDNPYSQMWLRRAAERGLASASHDLAEQAMQSGDRELAISWFRKATAGDWRNSFYPLGQLLEEDGDFDGAYEIYDRGARNTCNDSRDALCRLIVDRHIQTHYEVAYHLTRKAAEYGRPSAQARLGVMYRNGIGVRRDPAEAIIWLRKAMRQGHPAAQFLIGVAYHTGEHVAPDRAEAAYHLLTSAEQGNEEARLYLHGIVADLTGEEKQRLQNLDELRQSASGTSQPL